MKEEEEELQQRGGCFEKWVLMWKVEGRDCASVWHQGEEKAEEGPLWAPMELRERRGMGCHHPRNLKARRQSQRRRRMVVPLPPITQTANSPSCDSVVKGGVRVMVRKQWRRRQLQEPQMCYPWEMLLTRWRGRVCSPQKR